MSRARDTCRERDLVARLEGRDHLEDLGGRIILKWIIRRWDGEAFNAMLWFRIGTGSGLL